MLTCFGKTRTTTTTPPPRVLPKGHNEAVGRRVGRRATEEASIRLRVSGHDPLRQEHM